MIKAKDIMTKDVITVKPESTVEELARLLMKHRFSGVPVVDDENRLVGIVTEHDLISQNKRLHIPTIIRLFDAYIMLGSDKMESDIKKMAASVVGDICTRKVVSITEETTIEEIATIMSEKKIHLLPVLRNGIVVGIVGKVDIVGTMTGEAAK